MKKLALGVLVFLLCVFCYSICQAAPERTYIILPEGTVKEQRPQASAEMRLSWPKTATEPGNSHSLLFSTSPILMYEIKL